MFFLFSLTYENRMRRDRKFHLLLSQLPLVLVCNMQIKIKKDGETKFKRMFHCDKYLDKK